MTEDDEIDFDETSTEIVAQGIRQGLHEALIGQINMTSDDGL